VYQLYTDELRRVLSVAQRHAVQRQLDAVCVEHLLIALIEYGRGPVEEAFFALDITPSEAGAQCELLAVQPVAGSVEELRSLPYTPGAGRVLHLTLREMRELGNNFIGSQHLLLALLRHLDDPWAEPEPASEYLERLGVDLRRLREELLSRIPAEVDRPVMKRTEGFGGLPPIAQMDWWPGK
jgi:ATP-dependent Clp protease ATP-binding subunit ClpC